MIIITYRTVFYWITGILFVASLAAVAVFGLSLGIDFTGGFLTEIRYEEERPSVAEVESVLSNLQLTDVSVRASGTDGYIIRAQSIPEEARTSLAEALSMNGAYPANIAQFTEVGPTIGAELMQKAWIAFLLVIIGILAFITFAFRNVSRPVPSWIYGTIAVIALVHDVLITLGAFALLGFFFGAQVDALFVTAILTVLGFSVHDTIVVFDRVRENLHRAGDHVSVGDFEAIAGKSLNQTIVRSINTSIVVAFSLIALFFFGPPTTQDFALMLLVGVIAGTYSSVALATPLLVTVSKWRSKRSK